MSRTRAETVGQRRLVALLAVLFVVLLLPGVVLVRQAFAQLEWEALHQHRLQAEELVRRIDSEVQALVATEDRRPFSEYGFLEVEGEPSANFLQRSPLSNLPAEIGLPGLVGHFQVDPQGALTTPLLPSAGADPRSYGVPDAEVALRARLEGDIVAALAGANAAKEKKAEAPMAKADAAAPGRDARLDEVAASAAGERTNTNLLDQFEAVDRSIVGETRTTGVASAARAAPVSERAMSQAAAPAVELAGPTASSDAPSSARTADLVPAQKSSARGKRREQTALAEPPPPSNDADLAREVADLRVRIFESEIDPFSMTLLGDRHFALYRSVYRDRQRLVQGAVIERGPFLDQVAGLPFQSTLLAGSMRLHADWRGVRIHQWSGAAVAEYDTDPTAMAGEVLYRAKLSPPFADLELVLTVRSLAPGAGFGVVMWSGVAFVVVLALGFVALYALGARQLALARQQQDFVAAVSHELKTPLTSIRMYAEMLREGWAAEEKKRGYYAYIFDESERLSRLIANVLRLARIGRANGDLSISPQRAADLLAAARSKVESLIERAGFVLRVDVDARTDEVILQADTDAFCQIIINLIDNALKFAAAADERTIVLSTRLRGDGAVCFAVRDYGPGIAPGELRRIFRRFYRVESELTRATTGAGIGLALVDELARAMGGTVEARNADPGAEFVVSFRG